MRAAVINPALLRLLQYQGMAKVRRLRRSFSSRRRVLLSVIAVVLGVVWLANALASVVLREPYEPESFRRWISLALMLYFLWHVVRVAYKRPDEAVEWTPGERELLCGGPFSRRELISYRLTVILTASVPKAALVTLLLWPDLPMWWSGFLGLLMGLVLLEYVRLALETLACGVSPRTYFIARSAVFLALLVIVGGALWQSLYELSGEGMRGLIHGRAVIERTAATLTDYRETWIGRLMEAPFAVVAEVVSARRLSPAAAGQLGAALALLAAAGYAVVRLDGFYHARRRSRARRGSPDPAETADRRSPFPSRRVGIAHQQNAKTPRMAGSAHPTRSGTTTRLPFVPALGGVGPVFWRQMKGVRRYAGSVAFALGVPGVMSCLFLAVPYDAPTTFLIVASSAVFYSFVLLPAALKFDFRRDFDRLAALKMLPLRPAAVVVGQIAAPVLLGAGFQIAVVLIAATVRPVPAGFVAGAVLLLIPLTVFFVALDNLIFLLYPHRLQEEGLEVFLRSTLTFTAKALLLGIAAVIVFAWMSLSHPLAAVLGVADPRAVIAGGIIAMTTAAAAVTLCVLVRTFARFDPSLDQC